MNHVVMFSGGAGSWATALRVKEQYGSENLYLLFADTLMEDEDLYRFLDEAASHVGGKLIKIAEGRNPWKVFFDSRYLGNSRIDPCSRILKREFLRKYIDANYNSEEDIIYLGIDWTEIHRYEKAIPYWSPWTVKAPLCDSPYITKSEILEKLRNEGIDPPRLYSMGFPHNNCGGFCIKAGISHFSLLLEKLPEVYKYHEDKEQEIRKYLGKNISILKDRRNKETKPLTLKTLRERIEKEQEEIDKDDWGGCGCFSGDE